MKSAEKIDSVRSPIPGPTPYVERFPEGAARLKAAGAWPFCPLTGPMSEGPLHPGEQDPMDYRFDVEGQEWIHDPGWWQRPAGG